MKKVFLQIIVYIITITINSSNLWAQGTQSKVVVLGGGGGAGQTLKALEKYLGDKKEISSLIGVINNSDDGGSTGVLRKAYHTSALGDLGKCQLALGHYPDDQFMKVLDFRFNDGPLKGQSLRNIMMAALELQTGSINDALDVFGHLIQINPLARVLPVTSKAGTVQYQKGAETIVGQYQVAEVPFQKKDHHPQLDLLEYQDLNKEDFNGEATKAIAEADYIILAPGNVYATMLPLLATPGLKEAINHSKGKFIVVTPLFNRLSANQTNGWTVDKHLEVYKAYLGDKKFDHVVMNSEIPEKVPADYEMVLPSPELNIKIAHNKIIGHNLLEDHATSYASSDVIKRSPIKHDINRLAEVIVNQILKAKAAVPSEF